MEQWLETIKPGPSFTSWNMRAILDGRKIQTRRIIDLDPDLYKVWGKTHVKGRGVGVEVEQGGELFVHSYADYQPGELYYIREPVHCSDWPGSSWLYTAYDADGMFAACNGSYILWVNEDGSERKVDKLPGIYMPRCCARRFALIQDVWVERVQDISEEDIRAEGITEDNRDLFQPYEPHYDLHLIDAWKRLWIDIHGEESWERNPLVFAHEFEVMDREQARDYVKGESGE